MTDIHGYCDPRFEAVFNQFKKNFDEGLDQGGSFALSCEGEMVVDIWAGYRDRAGEQPWQEDTLINVYSTTKTMAAQCLLLLADRGEVQLDAKVSTYWPEFAQNGKENVEVRHFLSHSGQIPANRY